MQIIAPGDIGVCSLGFSCGEECPGLGGLSLGLLVAFMFTPFQQEFVQEVCHPVVFGFIA
jgi:hypothetical protein